MILDAAQTAGKIRIDLAESGVDILAVPGHKGLFGPMGTGVLIVAGDLGIEPFRVGGSGFRSDEDLQPVDLPWRLEAGTPNPPGIAGLLAGVRFVQDRGVDNIAAAEARLVSGFAMGLAGGAVGLV